MRRRKLHQREEGNDGAKVQRDLVVVRQHPETKHITWDQMGLHAMAQVFLVEGTELFTNCSFFNILDSGGTLTVDRTVL